MIEAKMINTIRPLKLTPNIFGALFIFLSSVDFAIPSPYKDRNNIEAGDNSFNLIASSGAQVIIFLDSKGNAIYRSREDMLAAVASDTPELVKSARARLSNSPESLVEDLAIADYAFKSGQYSSSAVLYSRVLKALKGNDSIRSTLSGLVTASYYGSQRHVRGLRFICQQYQALPRSDLRYRHAVHAHLRSLAVNLGHRKAEELLKSIRQNRNCQREDFSPVWIPIHLHDMRSLEKSKPPAGSVYGITAPKDYSYAQQLLQRNDVGLKDYLLFVLGKYETVIQQYPKSYVIDLALLGAGDSAPYKKAVKYLDEYYERFKKHRFLSRQILYRRAVEARDFAKVEELLNTFGSEAFLGGEDGGGVIFFQIDKGTRVWFKKGTVAELDLKQIGLITDFYSECKKIERELNTINFPRAIRALRRYAERYMEVFPREIYMEGWYGGKNELIYDDWCEFRLSAVQLKRFVDALEPVQDAMESRALPRLESIAIALKRCGDFRQGLPVDLPPKGFCSEFLQVGFGQTLSMHALSSSIIDSLLEGYVRDFDYAKIRFIKSLSLRNSRKYSEYAKVMKEIVEYHAPSVFVDDALTELGWYHLAVTRDVDAARKYLIRVVDEFPKENAYDNALNWLVILNRNEGRVIEAAKWSARLATHILSARLRSKIGDRDSTLRFIATQRTGVPQVVVGEDMGDFFGQKPGDLVVKVVRGDFLLLKPGDRIQKLDGIQVNSLLDFYVRLAEFALNGRTSVLINGYSAKNEALPNGIEVSLKAFGFGA